MVVPVHGIVNSDSDYVLNGSCSFGCRLLKKLTLSRRDFTYDSVHKIFACFCRSYAYPYAHKVFSPQLLHNAFHTVMSACSA